MTFTINSPKYGRHIVEIDDEDAERVLKYVWHVSYRPGGKVAKAVVTNIWNGGKNSSLKLHRLILPDNDIIDHIDGNVLNNKKNNLRPCTQRQNLWNMKRGRRNSSGFKGVYWDKNRNKFQAYIFHSDKKIHLGRFLTAEDAALAYNKAAKKYYGAFAWLNNVTAK